MDRLAQVFGPAYLDRVIRIDGPLVDPRISPPLDQSVDGRWKFGERATPTLTLVDPAGPTIDVSLPADWPGPTGSVLLASPLVAARAGAGAETADAGPWRRTVRAVSWHDDLGGMGAGYAAALGAALTSALGAEDDPTSRAVCGLLARYGIDAHPVRLPQHPADWTLLVTSGASGDKLPIGFRGCHAALAPADLIARAAPACRLRVVAALPNALAAEILRLPGAAVRFFAPAMRNMRDRDSPVSKFADAIDVISCNRLEWERLEDREEVAWRVSILAITDGPRGSCVRFTTPAGEPGLVTVPALPRAAPPRDTNRAGEAFAATLLTTLLGAGWSPGIAEEALVVHAARRASAAAALEIDMTEFGFPTAEAIDGALARGRIDSAAPEPAGDAPRDIRYNASGRERHHGEE